MWLASVEEYERNVPRLAAALAALPCRVLFRGADGHHIPREARPHPARPAHVRDGAPDRVRTGGGGGGQNDRHWTTIRGGMRGPRARAANAAAARAMAAAGVPFIDTASPAAGCAPEPSPPPPWPQCAARCTALAGR